MAPRDSKTDNPYEALQGAPAAELRSVVASHAAAAESKPEKPTNDQKEHLAVYRAFIRAFAKLSGDVTDDEVDLLGFPSDSNTLYDQQAMFMVSLRKPYLHPETSAEYGPITYSELSEYRDSMLFWVNRFFGRMYPSTAKPLRKDLETQMEKAMVSESVLISKALLHD